MIVNDTKKRARRGRSEGSIFQRESDGLWVGTASLGCNGAGKRVRRTVYGSTKKEVAGKLDTARMESRIGNLPDVGSMTIGQLLDQWLKTTEPKVSTRTFEERERLVKNHLRPRLGGLKIAKLNGLHIEGLYADMHRDQVGKSTIRSAADVLSIALNNGVKLRLLPANPSAAVAKPKIPKRDMLFLTDEQAKEVLIAARESNLSALVALALGTGCRQGELLGIGWDDLDLRKGTVTIRRSLSQTKAGFVLKEPKTAASCRTIALPDFAIEELKTHKMVALKSGTIAASVFCTRTGNYLNKKNVLRAFRGIVKAANKSEKEGRRPIAEKLRFHDLRHSVASMLLSKGHSLRAVSQRLGHANPTMTLRVYAHCMPTDDVQLAEGLNKLMA